ncbi:MAG: ceramidase domain-containing protein [Acidobacteria bacterium]|nr:ceramidase domain-containing protein [Acidobacteriota bacterium]
MNNWRIVVLIGLAGVAIAIALAVPPVAQDPAYHAFADRRTLAGIPHFWNVISNAPFLFAGLYGLWGWRRSIWAQPGDRWPWLVVALASLLIGAGSGYYHADPNTQSLFWDRLPMTLAFMGIFSAAIAERIHARRGVLLLAPFLLLGVLSVEVWRRGELTGAGDLRSYALVQFYPMIALPLILWMFPARYSHAGGMWWMAILYGAAKLLEVADAPLYSWSGETISGHSLKHIGAALALAAAFRMLAARRPLY